MFRENGSTVIVLWSSPLRSSTTKECLSLISYTISHADAVGNETPCSWLDANPPNDRPTTEYTRNIQLLKSFSKYVQHLLLQQSEVDRNVVHIIKMGSLFTCLRVAGATKSLDGLTMGERSI